MKASCLRSNEIFRIEKRIEKELGIKTLNLLPFKCIEPLAYEKGSKSLTVSEEGFFRVIPPNDGSANYTDYFWQDIKVFTNQQSFTNIQGIEVFLERTLDLYQYALDNGICVNPQYLFTRISIRELSIITGDCLCISDETLKVEEINTSAYDVFVEYLNSYLDSFVGLNFGKILNENERLQNKFFQFRLELDKYRCRKKAFSLPNISYSKYVLPCEF